MDQISMGHARAIINLPDIESKLKVLKKIIEHGLSVRQVESISREVNSCKPAKKEIYIPENLLIAKEKLIEQLGTKVDVKATKKGAGSIVISFDSETDFERILSLLK